VWRAVATLAALGLAACGSEAAAPAPERDSETDPAPEFVVEASAVKRPRGRFVTARIVRRTPLRASPRGPVVARLGRRSEFGSARVLAVTRRRDGWLRVVASELANGEHGWIRARAARLGATDVSLVVDRSRRVLTLRRGRRVLRRLPVAVGRPDTPTPLGRFAVTDRLRSTRPDSPYGCCAVALSGHQTKLLPGWPGGDRLAIHGTPQPETIGEPVSLGCMRARTADLRALMRIVPLGAPVFVRA
jgi:lipoprotein-anchoring transpeptidase ErfK/SrfK